MGHRLRGSSGGRRCPRCARLGLVARRAGRGVFL